MKNERIQHMMRYIFMCLMVLGSYNYAFAQDVVFKAIVGAQKVGIDDAFELKYVLENVSAIKTLDPPQELQSKFQLLRNPVQGYSSQTVNYNGRIQTTTSLNVTYVIKAKRKGTFTIPEAIARDAEGNIYRSNPVTITVIDGSVDQRRRQQQQNQNYNQPQPNQQPGNNSEDQKIDLSKDLFLKVVVDKNSVYQGEQITASYKLYSRVPGYQFIISKLPSLNGFWTQDFLLPKDQNEQPVVEKVNGIPYHVLTLKKSALFPQQSGKLELDPTEVSGVARIVQKIRQNPFGDSYHQNMMQNMFMNDPHLYDQFFSRMIYKDIPVTLTSKPVYVNVKELVDTNQNSSFTGAVGNFSIKSSIDKTSATTDDVITLTLEIRGQGNIKLINAPILDLPNGLTSYDPQIIDTITERTTHISGSKTIIYTITPQTPGKYEIASIPFTYFDPNIGKYTTLKTEPFSVDISAGETYKPELVANKTITDIHPISTKGLTDNTPLFSKPLLYTIGYWGMYAVPLFAFIGIILWKKRENDLAKDTISLRNKRANKVAFKRLKNAQKLLQQNERSAFYEETSKAIWLYLSDKLHIPLSSLSKDNAYTALSKYNISQQLQHELDTLITECETSLYAASKESHHMNTTYDKAIDIISKLEESFKA